MPPEFMSKLINIKIWPWVVSLGWRTFNGKERKEKERRGERERERESESERGKDHKRD
jgi:hypothetical protein